MQFISNTQSSMTHREYLGDLIGGSLMLKESQTIAVLLLKKPTQAEWDDAIINQNILQKRSDASAKRNASTIKKRLAGLPMSFLELVAYGTTDLSSQMMFAATLINSPLLKDFMKHGVQDVFLDVIVAENRECRYCVIDDITSLLQGFRPNIISLYSA